MDKLNCTLFSNLITIKAEIIRLPKKRTMTICLKLIYMLNVIFIKIPVHFFAEIDKPVPKFIWKCKGLIITKTLLKKKHQIGGISLSRYKLLLSYSNQDCVKKKKKKEQHSTDVRIDMNE